MSTPGFGQRLWSALRELRFGRLALLLAATIAATLVSDWLRRDERVIFPAPLPVFTTVPASR